MTVPRVSILICSHNGARTIGAAIESALNQKTDIPFELIVVDDGSTDNTSEIVRKFGRAEANKLSGRIDFAFMPLRVNVGLSLACNTGLQLARGKYFTRLDDDDIFFADAISSMCPPLVSGESDWSYCDRLIVDAKTGLAKRFNVGPPSVDSWLSRLSACGVMMRRDLVMSLGGYRPVFWHEYDLYMRFLELTGKMPSYAQKAVYVCGGHTRCRTSADAKMMDGWKELAGIWGEDKLRSHGFGEFLGSGDAA